MDSRPVSLIKFRRTANADHESLIHDIMSVIVIRRGPETKEPVFDYLSGVFRCDKEKFQNM